MSEEKKSQETEEVVDSFASRIKKYQKQVRRKQFMSKIDNLLAQSQNALQEINKLGRRPTVFGWTSLLLRGVRLGLSVDDVNPEQSEDMGTVQIPESHSEIIFKLIKKYCKTEPLFGDKYLLCHLGANLVIMPNTPAGVTSLFYSKEACKKKDIQQEIAAIIWKHVGGKAHMTFTQTGGVKAVYQTLEPLNVRESERANDVIKRLNSFLQQGVNRSVLFYGAPGSGKTCLINKVAEHFEGRCLYVDVADVNQNVGFGAVTYAAKLLCPDIVIINDFDRMSGIQSYLTSLEEINKNVQLFLASANYISKIPAAALRPERFDDLIKLDHLDEDVARLLLDGLPIDKKEFELIKRWPAVFIKDLAYRLRILGMDKFEEEYSLLKERIEINRRTGNND